MPYPGIPKKKWGKLDQCVQKVMGRKGFKPYKGSTKKGSAIAICRKSMNV